MKRLLGLGLLCLIPAISGCSTQASASQSDNLRAFTYTTEGGDSGGPIRMRSLDTSAGELSPDSAQSPDKIFFGDLCVHPRLPMLFATEGNLRIQAFQVDPQNGTLTPKASSMVPSSLESDDELVAHPGGRTLYLCHNDRVTPFTLIDNEGTLVPSTPVKPTGATDLNHGVVDRTGQLLYVADRNNGNIWGYRIDEAGSLTPVSPHPVASIVGGTLRRLVIDDSNRFLFALNDNGDQVVGYTLRSDGVLSANGGSKSVGASGERHLDMVTRNDLLFIAEQTESVTKVYRIDKIGNLSPEGNGSQGGGVLSLPRSLKILVNANNTGVFSVRAQLLSQDGQLKAVEGKETPNACLDLETIVTSTPE
ncbi:hypothetical protein IV102_24975 [bacterium]|nr:hypothetical protein [bacterium]